MRCENPRESDICQGSAKYAVLESEFSDMWVRYCQACYDTVIGLPVPKLTPPTYVVILEELGAHPESTSLTK